MRTRPVHIATALGCCAVLALTGCSNRASYINRTPQSGSTTATPIGGVQQITLKAGDDYRFTPDTITVHPGKVTITLVNTGAGAPHDFSLTGFPGDAAPLAQAGASSTATFEAPAPGRYQFVCTIHVAQGQTGTLVVLPN